MRNYDRLHEQGDFMIPAIIAISTGLALAVGGPAAALVTFVLSLLLTVIIANS